jgi:muramoyltetrapeptide carboxypeptidase
MIESQFDSRADNQILRGRSLAAGDLVRLVSPASAPTREWLAESIAILTSWGFRVDVGEHAMDQHGISAGTDRDRIADLNNAFRDPEVRAVITTRGGAGSYRIADLLDVDAVRADPKPLLGFSDITNIHLALWKHCRLATIHGALAGATAQRSVLRLLTRPGSLTIPRNPDAFSASVGVAGRAQGPLVGGNLRELVGWIGAGLPSLAGSIVLIEDLRHVGIGQVDRHLNHLRRSGSLDGIAGVAVGSFEDFAGYSDSGWDVMNILRNHLTELGVPVLGGLDLGHGIAGTDGNPDQYAATLGATAVLDTEEGTLTVGACVR